MNMATDVKPDSRKPRRVVGVDIDIRAHNRKALEEHPLYPRMTLIEGSSIDPGVIDQVYVESKESENILVCLDSNHTHDHVLSELQAYAPLTGKNSYCIVFDGIAEDLPKDFVYDRPWGVGDNPKTAIWEYLESLANNQEVASDGSPLHFKIDKELEAKLQITVAPDGYLQRTAL